MIDVLVVEDSRVTLEYLVHVLGTDPEIRISGTAASGEEALASAARHKPDVILMDIHLPGIDGFETTKRIMASNPVPIVVCTASTSFDQVHTVMRALEVGALAVLKKPRGLGDPGAENEAAAIISTLKLMSEIKVVRRWTRAPAPAAATRVPSTVAEPTPRDVVDHDVAIVVIGASTGGPPVVAQILSGLSLNFAAPILVVQHISTGFTTSFAE